MEGSEARAPEPKGAWGSKSDHPKWLDCQETPFQPLAQTGGLYDLTAGQQRPFIAKCLCANVQSLFGKIDELKLLTSEENFDIMFLTETWLTDDISDGELSIPGYSIFRRDRFNRKGGGIAIYIKSHIPVSTMKPIYSVEQNVETLTLSFRENSPKECAFCVIYRPPNQSFDVDSQLLEEIAYVINHRNALIVGDFNAPGVDWEKPYGHWYSASILPTASAVCSGKLFGAKPTKTNTSEAKPTFKLS